MHNVISNDAFVVIDLGSTSFQLLVAKEINGSLQIISKIKQAVHLAEGLNDENMLSDDAIARGLKCIALFADYLAPLQINKIKIVGTYTLRTAKNIHTFIEQAQQILPYPINIISGEEEARLIYFSTMNSQSDKNKKLVIDIGGGSTEIILGSNKHILLLESKNIGCVTLTTQFFKENVCDKACFDKAVIYAESIFQTLSPSFQSETWKMALGTSGTIRAIYNVLLELEKRVHCITPQSLNHLIDEMFKTQNTNMLILSVLSDNRKSVFLAGVAILKALFNTLKIDCLSLCTHGIREGILYEMLNDQKDPDLSHSIHSLSKQFYIDKKQAHRVLKTTMYFYRHFQKKYPAEQFNDIVKNILFAAAQLHEIGWIINSHSIQKHSAYILKHCQQLTLDKEQKALLVSLVRFHRKTIKVDELASLNLVQDHEIFILLFILRLAILLNKSHKPIKGLSKIEFAISENKIFLVIPLECIRDNSFLQAKLNKERDYWRNTQIYELFISVK